MLNALIGGFLILFTSLIAVQLSGYQAGILTILFLLLSPRLLGHSLNNLKDIPFALGYLMALYGIIRSIIRYPKIHYSDLIFLALGFGIAFGTRAGGLIIIPLALFFGLLTAINEIRGKDLELFTSWWPGIRLAGALLLALAIGYLLGILYWPFALENPVKNPIDALQMMTHYEVSIRQVFNGQWVWSEKLPWFYGSKWILITSPIVILAGFFIQFAFPKKLPWPLYSLLLFATVFPILWTLVKDSNLYGGWRHLLFVYPVIAVFSALAWCWILEKFNRRIPKVALISLIGFGMIGPGLHTLRNHPLEYVYFNQLVGGTRSVQGRYETDYYFNALNQALKWLNENYPEAADSSRTIASNFPLDAFFQGRESQAKTIYLNYYNRGKSDWDFGIFSSTYIDPRQLQQGNWSPANTIHTVYVDQVPVCIVLKRNNKDDFKGLHQFLQSRFVEADSLFSSSLQTDPHNETSLLYKAWTQRHLNQLTASNTWADSLLLVHPLSDHALDLKARNAIRSENYPEAKKLLNQLFQQNYKFLPAYEQMGVLQDSLKDYPAMARYLNRGYRLGLRNEESIKALVRAYELSGNQAEASKFRTILNK